jgi:hypothetical protein
MSVSYGGIDMRRPLVLVCGLLMAVVVSPAVASARPAAVSKGAVAGRAAPPVSFPAPASAAPAAPAAAARPSVSLSGSARSPSAAPVSASGAVVVTGAPAGGRADVDGAFARRGANTCSWTVGSPGIEKTFTFDASAGTYLLTSFENTLVDPARQYIAPGVASAEFRFTWDGTTLTGASGGWSCASGKVSKVDAGGAPALQLDVSLSRPSAGVRVTKHYVVYPGVALIRQWTDYANTGSVAHALAQPSFLEQRVMGNAVADTDLTYMNGAYQYTLQKIALTPDYSRVFDSYDDGTFHETTTFYEPWFSLFNRVTGDGVYLGFDYFGRWAMSAGVADGTGTSLSLALPNYDAPLAAGASISSPKAFDAVYKTDLDDMTNRILAWQYTYMWDYTRTPYFGAVRNEGQTYQTGDGDPSGQLQQVFNLTDNLSAVGVDDYHRDYGWWDRPGDWDGPDWRITNNYLSKFGMTQTIYYFAYDAVPESRIATAHPDWFLPSACSYGGGLADLRIPAARAWMQGLLVSNAQRWGDYEWRNDACPMGDFPGDQQLGQDQGFRSVLQGFLDARPGSGFQGVNSGGNEFGFDYLRFVDGTSFTDAGGYTQQDGGSRLYPVDKLSGVPEGWRADGGRSDLGFCDARFTTQLMWSPDLQGYTSDPAALECMRKVVDIYHYILAHGVAGRWVRQYHPRGSDADTNWFERLSWDGQRGLIVYKGDSSASAVTVYPKGLNPARSYDVRFQLQGGSSRRSGADLMANGVPLPSIAVGELVYLNLPGHPGAGTDHVAPAAPEHVTAVAGTQMGANGVEVSWSPGTDNNWVSYYQVSRNGQVIGKTAKGTFYFDHTPAATPSAIYTVRTVDGDANMSLPASSAGGQADVVVADDASAGISYTGGWAHFSGLNGSYAGTQSAASSTPCHVACQQFSGVLGRGDWGYQDGPASACFQACQQFSGVQGTGNWSYQEQPPPPPPVCHLACQQFTGVQGQNNWSYQTATGGVWADIATYHTPFGLFGECCAWYDLNGSEFSGLVSPRYILGGAGHDTARAWTAPVTGVIGITAQAIPFATGNQAVVTITQNGQPIFGPQAMDGTTNPLDTSVASLSVTAGDVIRFEVQGATTLTIDNLLQWDPDILYQGDQPPPPPPPPPPFVNMATYHGTEDFVGDGPFWHDGNGYLSARLSQAASDRNIARAWTAPTAGTVDISGQVADDTLDTSGSASTVRITLNNQIIWGPQTIAAGDTSGQDAAVPAVAVSAGDVIRFEVAAGGGTVAWDPGVTYQGDPPVVSPAPGWTDMTTFHPGDSLSGDGPFWHDAAGYVSARLIQSALRRDVARTWTAPRAGTIDISGHASDAGAAVSITLNGRTVWGPQIAYTIDTNVSGLAVSAGDVIKFVVGAGGQQVQWDPDIAYQGEPPPVLPVTAASWTFTGSQVTWYAEIGPDHGTAQVLIDGQPDASINLYGPSAGDWSIPIYVKTFPVAGTHTITIQPAPDTGGSTVDVDGFQAVATSPAVTQDSGKKVDYHGRGWVSRASAPASGGSLMASTRAGDSVSFGFTGTSVTWVGRTCAGCGEADVYLDGTYVTRIDTYGYRGPEVWQAGLFQHSWTYRGKHTLTIVVDGTSNLSSAGTEVDVDSFQVGG